MRVSRLIRHFRFTEAERGGLTIAAGARLDSARSAITLAGEAGTFSLASAATVRTRLWKPASAQAWLSFEAVLLTPKSRDGTASTSVTFRLSSDGVADFVWDSMSSTWVAASGSVWTSEADVAAHVGEFFAQQGERALQIVVRLLTTDADVAPSVSGLKVLWASDIEAVEDAVTRSLVPSMRAGVRPWAVALLKTAASAGTVAVADLGLETGYDVTSIDAVFDDTADAEHLTDLLASYDATLRVATLASSIPAGHVAWVRFLYAPTVAVTTSRDYDEVGAMPAIIIRDVKAENATMRASRDSVINKATRAAASVRDVIQGDLVLRVEWHTEKLTDHQRLASALHQYFADNTLLRIAGDDEDRRLWLVDEYDDDVPPEGDKKDVHVGVLGATICGVVLRTKTMVDLSAVKPKLTIVRKPGPGERALS